MAGTQALLAELSEDLGLGDNPGVATRVARISKNTVSMKLSFQRPLAIGYRGFAFYIDKNGALDPNRLRFLDPRRFRGYN